VLHVLLVLRIQEDLQRIFCSERGRRRTGS
jgi:hypothetical protein